MNPTIRALSPAPMRRARSWAASDAASSALASRRNCSPAGVSVTSRVLRVNSSTRSSCSSCRTCRDSAGWVTCRATAAWPKCRRSATATK
nr:hypothetical protein [Streptomyces chartreusis]